MLGILVDDDIFHSFSWNVYIYCLCRI